MNSLLPYAIVTTQSGDYWYIPPTEVRKVIDALSLTSKARIVAFTDTAGGEVTCRRDSLESVVYITEAAYNQAQLDRILFGRLKEQIEKDHKISDWET